MVYEIVNMSDPYTVEVPDLEMAAAVCVLLGSGQYALQPLDQGGEEVPVFLGGTAHEWFRAHFDADASDVVQRVMNLRREALADALDSVLIGYREDRASFDVLRVAASPETYR